MVRPSISEPLPSSVKLAAGLFVAYGVAVVLNATAIQGTSGWVGAGDFPRALIRLFGTGLIGWGLLRRARWAWWIGLVFAAFWLVADALAVLVIERGDVYWLRPGGLQIFLVVSLLCLGLAVALLLSPSVRAVFRRPAA
jgi:hypothetical protein